MAVVQAKDIAAIFNTLRDQRDEARAETNTLRELIAQLAPETPMNQDEQGGCVWCGWSEQMLFYEQKRKGGSMYSDERPETHTPDCPWVAARNILADE